MNLEYLNTLPEVANKYGVELQEEEKVVLVTVLSTFGTEKDRMLGTNCSFTMTNQRIIIDNNVGIWTIDIAEDIADFTRVKGGFLFFKYEYIAVNLNDVIVFDHGKQKLSGYHFYFNDDVMTQFEEIMNKLLN